MIEHHSAGAIVFRAIPRCARFLVLQQRSRMEGLQWVAPKGHIEHGETPEEAAVRELAEEAGLRVLRSYGVVGDETYTFVDQEQLRHKKTVCWYLFEVSPNSRVTLAAQEGFLRAIWLDASRATSRFTHAGFRKVFRRAVRLLNDRVRQTNL